MNLLIEDAANEAHESLYDDRPAFIPEIISGGSLPIQIARVKRIANLFNGRIFDPQSSSGWSFRASLGGGFVLPVAGRWPITFTAEDDTSESFSYLNFDTTEFEISDALNSLSKVQDVGGLIVRGQDGFFEITFNEPGARNLLAGNAAQLVPLSLLVFDRAVEGDDDTQEVQTLRILQNTGAIVSLTDDAPSATIPQTDLVVGNGSRNAKIRVTLPTNRYDGTWTVTRSATTSGLIGYSDNAAQVQAILQTAFGSGNVLVSQSGVDSYDLTFTGTLGLQAITISLDGTSLLILPTFSGELDLTAVGVDLLLGNADAVTAGLEIEGAPSGGATRKLWQTDLLLVRPIKTADSTVPTSEVEAYSISGDDLSPTAVAQTLTLAPTARFLQAFQKITILAGTGAYTVKVVLKRANAIKGAMYRIQVVMPASSNPTVIFYDNDITGTVLDTLPGDSSNAMIYNFEARFTGAAWVYYRSAFQP